MFAIGLLALLSWLLACGGNNLFSPTPVLASVPRFDIFTAPELDSEEQSCAWYSDERDGVLYFGESAFWSGLRKTGSALGELDHSGPRRIGRFDLKQRTMLAPLVLSKQHPSGTWDVLAHPNGRVYYTTFFGNAGWIDPTSGRTEDFPQLGTGLNEWASGPGDTLLVSRYADEGQGDLDFETPGNAVLWIDPDGKILDQWPLPSVEDGVLAPKTVAWDPLHNALWVTTDRLPERPGPQGHPTVVLGLDGLQHKILTEIEVQYARFSSDGTGYFAVSSGPTLELAILPPDAQGPGLEGARRILLDPHFHSELDFAQDLNFVANGDVLITTWGGKIYWVDPRRPGRVRVLAFPRGPNGGLYYSAVGAGPGICATYCDRLSVVCTQRD